MHAHRVSGGHDLYHILEDEEPKQGSEIKLAEERRQDTAVDL